MEAQELFAWQVITDRGQRGQTSAAYVVPKSEEKEEKELGGRMKLEKGFLTIVVEGLKWMSEADNRQKTNLMYSDL